MFCEFHGKHSESEFRRPEASMVFGVEKELRAHPHQLDVASNGAMDGRRPQYGCRPEEFTVLRRNAWLQVFGLSMISLGIFLVAGAEIALIFGILWLVGAVLGGVAIAHIPRGLHLKPT